MGKTIRESVLSLIALAVIFGTTAVFHLTQSFCINFSRGEKFMKDGRYMMSLSYLLSAASANPQKSEVFKDLAIVYNKLDRKEDSLRTLQSLEKTGMKDVELKQWLADAYYGNNSFSEAERLYRQVLTKKNTPAVKRKLAEVTLWQGKYNKAQILLTQLCNKYPSDYKSRELLADVCSWKKDYDRAIELYEQVMTYNTGDYDVLLKLADAMRYSGKDRQAIELYKKYIEKAG